MLDIDKMKKNIQRLFNKKESRNYNPLTQGYSGKKNLPIPDKLSIQSGIKIKNER